MNRKPINVLILPFQRFENIEYAVFKRADMGIWQFIAGGVEEKESTEDAAIRETFEETGVPTDSKFYKLDSSFTITADNFPEERIFWNPDIFVVPVYCFAVECENFEIVISHEHTEFCWSDFKKSDELLYFSNDKGALWELDQRIKYNNLINII